MTVLHTAGNGEELTIVKVEQVIEALEQETRIEALKDSQPDSIADAVRLIRFLVHVIEQPAAETHDSLPIELCAAVGRLENARARVQASASRNAECMVTLVDAYSLGDLDTAARQVLRFTAQGLGLAV